MKKLKKKTKDHINKRRKQIIHFFKNVWEILNRPEMSILPGQLAFHMILSFVPILTLIGYGASYFNISSNYIISALASVFGEDIVNVVIPIISGDPIDLKLIIMFCIMFYVASNGPASIILTANEIYGINQSSWLKRRFKAVILTIILVILYIFIFLVPVLGSKIINAVDYFHIKSIITSLLTILKGPISWLIIFVFIKTIFTLAPDKEVPASQIDVGAIFTTFGWILATYIYGYYASHFAKYSLYYAGLSNLAVLMLWVYILSYILVIGLSLTTSFQVEELEKIGFIKHKK